MIGVVDYKAGNLKSVDSALSHLHGDFFISDDPEKLLKCDKMIFPGVGEAYSAMEVLRSTGLGEAVKEFASSGKPLLGICLGAQIVFDHSEERDTPCLGIIPGKVKRFAPDMGLKVPHMGWNTIEYRELPLFKDIPQNSSFYFVHSYYIASENDENVAAICEYGIPFTAAAVKDNILACQFHPEKSGEPGLQLLKNFIELY
ncbi:imidazole glycerol phosphate synthase subunit HisH [Spirochaeta isovalerica]|uniref:Imidazole glycerol phosphate synthase subunit HisH n=1 Tax=Spirochaeta isovalerica TaxID=150 RepID=A0A841RAM4_9SPIO|nr:imidazole glycerol phosphate synthase subunit HisH [Spirochaeta isovalerica]MBB6480766.1 glutamine amidotransferase [Spirochaeta isovalerica]